MWALKQWDYVPGTAEVSVQPPKSPTSVNPLKSYIKDLIARALGNSKSPATAEIKSFGTTEKFGLKTLPASPDRKLAPDFLKEEGTSLSFSPRETIKTPLPETIALAEQEVLAFKSASKINNEERVDFGKKIMGEYQWAGDTLSSSTRCVIVSRRHRNSSRKSHLTTVQKG